MGPIPEDTPWWAWVLVAILVLFVYPMYKVDRATRNQEVKQKETAARLSRVDYQVSNEHNTNLRDDVDRSIVASEKAVELARAIERHQRETRRDIGGMREDHRLLARRVDSVIELDRQKFESLLKYVQALDQRVQGVEKKERGEGP